MGKEQDDSEQSFSMEGSPGARKNCPGVLVVCGPSGAGKSTLINLLMRESQGFGFSVSHTTRKPRGEEQEGLHYYFTSKDEFEQGLIEGRFLEHARVHDNFYGTSQDAVASVIEAGKCCVLDIDVQGARQVRGSGINAVFIFIAPPSLAKLESRLRARGTDSEEQVERRLKAAMQEIESSQEPGLFDFCIVNDDLSDAYSQLRMIAMGVKDGEANVMPEIEC